MRCEQQGGCRPNRVCSEKSEQSSGALSVLRMTHGVALGSGSGGSNGDQLLVKRSGSRPTSLSDPDTKRRPYAAVNK